MSVLDRLAHMLASSFNFQGKVKKTFFVLTDDKVGSGPRLRPGALSQAQAPVEVDEPQPMDTDSQDKSSSASTDPVNTPSPKPSGSGSPKPPSTPSLASKLAAQAVKRKAADPPNLPASKQRQK
jgi:hypothetical protein